MQNHDTSSVNTPTARTSADMNYAAGYRPALRMRTQAETAESQPEVTEIDVVHESFSDVLQHARANRNVTISDVSRKTLIPASFISDVENSRFNNLPDKDLCLSRLEKLCLEYDIPASAGVLDSFVAAYDNYHQSDIPQADDENTADDDRRHPFTPLKPGRFSGNPIRLPSLIISTLVVILLLLMGYAFYAYKTHGSPAQLDADLTAHIPIYTPKPIYLDQPADKQ